MLYCIHFYKSLDIFSSLHSLDALVSNLLHTDSCRNSINHPVHWPLPGNFWKAISWTTSLFTYSSWSSAPPSALFTERVLSLPTVPHGHHWKRPEWSIRPSSSIFLNPRLTSLSFTQYNPCCLSIPWNWIFTLVMSLVQALIVSFKLQYPYLKTWATQIVYCSRGQKPVHIAISGIPTDIVPCYLKSSPT